MCMWLQLIGFDQEEEQEEEQEKKWWEKELTPDELQQLETLKRLRCERKLCSTHGLNMLIECKTCTTHIDTADKRL